MSKSIYTSPITEGCTVIENGEQYYIIGKNKIKIKEHFPDNGKQLEELITDLIANKIREKEAEIS